ncbi:putative lipid II flippase FtsW [Candidatus Daviesbacteria bacterium]|nr:putative lipid II flippase FtsW [Candidatus Daviesbacteria bacterium]
MRSNIHLKSQKKTFDLPLFATVLILVLFGLLMVYDASSVQALRDFKDSYYYIRQQIMWVGLGMISLFFFANFSYIKFKVLAAPLLGVSFVLLLAVFIPGLGVSGGGAHRWLKLGGVTVQPAEVMKLTAAIFLASIFEKRTRVIPFIILIVAVSAVTAVMQKDLGSTLVFVASSLLMYFASGGPLWHFLLFLPAMAGGIFGLIATSGYRSKRILAFLDPFSDPQGFTYHIFQVLIALGTGGLLGLGLGQSRQKFEYIPEVSTDSIFGIIGEELGFLGGAFLILLFSFLILRCLIIADKCEDRFGKILAVGLTSWLGIQTAINLSSMVALLPLTGVPLPFISYGGSALLANLTAVGIMLNISKTSQASH